VIVVFTFRHHDLRYQLKVICWRQTLRVGFSAKLIIATSSEFDSSVGYILGST